MMIITGYIWGIWWWRTSDTNTCVDNHLCGLRSLGGCLSTSAQLREAGLDRLQRVGLERGIPSNILLDVVTNKLRGHQSSKTCVKHQCRQVIPPGSICRIEERFYVFTPAFCLLQIASIATERFGREVNAGYLVVVIAQLGCELCGQYSLSDKSFIQRLPLTTVGDLWYLAFAMSGAYGVNLLRQALPWVIDGCRSPKETDLYLLLCLPPTLGGFDLPRPRSNFDIDLRDVTSGYFARWQSCNVDFYWGQARLIVEYDSKTYHTDADEKKRARDKARADALRCLGYVVVTVRYEDLYDAGRLRAKAKKMADALGMELPPDDEPFIDAQNTLRAMLLRHDRWV